MPMSSKEMLKLLKENGFEVISQNGSHVKMKNLKTDKTVIVPYHSKDLKKDWSRQYLNRQDLDSPVA